MDLKTLLADAVTAVKAAMPPTAGADAARLLEDAIATAQTVADQEVAAATAKVPPELAPYAADIDDVLMTAMARLRTVAEDRAAQLPGALKALDRAQRQ